MSARAHPPNVHSAFSAVAEPAPGAAVLPRPPVFSQVFQQHLPFVWRVLRSMGAPPADLDDLCQDVFVIVHRRLAEFEGRSSLSSWLYAICWRVWQDQRRRAYRRRERSTATPPEGVATFTPGDAAAQSEAVVMLTAILDRMDADKRAVFVLYEIEQMGMKEVAAAMDCPLQTAYTRLHAARDQVRREWRRLTEKG
jgi:RNA polymerase sigma-70 factor (ECF subfamily)